MDARAAPRGFVWWPWAAGIAALFLALAAYGPALDGAFVFDDRYLPFFLPQYANAPWLEWVRGLRPMLMFSFWLNYRASGVDPYSYHAFNVLLHVFNSVMVALIAMRLLARAPEGAAAEGDTRLRPTLGIFAGALFLLHPIQTESVAYVASRSEVLAASFYLAAYCVFLYRRTQPIGWLRALAVLALFGGALATKEHTLTLPALLLLTDLFWVKGGLRANLRLYVPMALAGALGGAFVYRILSSGNTAGFHTPGFTPATYFYTQWRVICLDLRLLVLPFGQNADPDVPVSHTPFDPLAFLGLLLMAALLAAAWIFRKRWPLASFGVFTFFLLLAPTSSIVPIADAMAERRVYLPFVGFALVCVEFLRPLKLRRRAMIEVPALLALFLLTYQRNAVWGDPMKLWQDTVAKSPRKVRPRSQLAFAYYERKNCPAAAENYEAAARLAPPDYPLLVNWAYSLDCAGQPQAAIEKLLEASKREYDPQAWALLGMVYGKQHKVEEALHALDRAQNINANYVMTYAVRGNVYESTGDFAAAAEQYQRALQIDPSNEPVREALGRVLARR